MVRNTWTFDIVNLDTGELLNKGLTFYGIDSEDAFYTCVEWAEKKYGVKCHADLSDGSAIERNENMRNYIKAIESESKPALKPIIMHRIVKKGS